MDHKQAIAAIPDDERKRLIEKSNGPGLIHAAVHFGLIGAIGYLIAIEGPGWPLLMLPQGILIIFLFTLLHEASHLTPFSTHALNKLAAWISGFAIMVPPEWFLYFHFAHHRHTQDPDRDPELAFPKPSSLSGYVWHITGVPVWIGNMKQLFGNLFYAQPDDFTPSSAYGKVRLEAWLMLFGYIGLAAGSVALDSDVLIWTWIVPLLIGQPFLRLYLLAEHGLMPNVDNMLENSRTVRSNFFVRKLAWNMPWHIEHHAWPTVPFHNLPALHEHLRAHTPEPTAGYTAFHRAYMAMLLKTGAAKENSVF